MFLNIQGAAQNRKIIDSLYHLLNTVNHDTGRVSIYLKIGILLEGENLDSAIIFYNKALNVCDANASSKLLEFKKLRSDSYNNLGIGELTKGNFDAAVSFFEKAAVIAIAIKDLRNISATCANIGNAYCGQSNFQKALPYYYTALKIEKEHLHDTRVMGIISGNIGNIYSTFNNFSKAVEYYTESLKCSKEVQNVTGTMATMNNLGRVYFKHGDLKEALKYYLQASEMARASGQKDFIITSYIELGTLYAEYNITLAIRYFEKALTEARNLHSTQLEATALIKLGDCNYVTRKFDKALRYTENALSITASSDIINKREAFGLLSRIHLANRNYKSAYKNYRLAFTLKDSLTGLEVKNKINEHKILSANPTL